MNKGGRTSVTAAKRRLPRSRDRVFLPEKEQQSEELPLSSIREIKLVKVKGSHLIYQWNSNNPSSYFLTTDHNIDH